MQAKVRTRILVYRTSVKRKRRNLLKMEKFKMEKLNNHLKRKREIINLNKSYQKFMQIKKNKKREMMKSKKLKILK